ncbi:helix-turn-helix domain-containing protein [Sulfurisphaera ohwakuensis]|uniref:MarR family transcriptional regulator n=1 Tax=Sulfurisphaera ohwakuensis TaxID=69656 RepID=A0A650CFF1_SULOH|nr:helix-turn-helix domain-containing protein [Sulfurisphaera ohwakuensis]MBB5254770.1 putative transcriptional regulator [Sulfurisphaera ohwakuensis]QGR16395.1 MarR family transcriptional regulator [Sulfurisphaera ohwakuensis]
MSERLKFPDGREVDIHEVLSFLYGLGGSEIQVLHLLLTEGKMSSDEIAEKLKVSKASINKAINTLLDKGLVEREKITEEKRRGRPTFMYYVRKDYMYKKIENDTLSLIFNVRENIKKLLSERA